MSTNSTTSQKIYEISSLWGFPRYVSKILMTNLNNLYEKTIIKNLDIEIFTQLYRSIFLLKNEKIQTSSIYYWLVFFVALVNLAFTSYYITSSLHSVEGIDNYMANIEAKNFSVAKGFVSAIIFFAGFIGLIFKQYWGWFFSQYFHTISLPLMAFYSIFIPDFQTIARTLISGIVIILLFNKKIIKIFFSKSKTPTYLFYLAILAMNIVILISLEFVIIKLV